MVEESHRKENVLRVQERTPFTHARDAVPNVRMDSQQDHFTLSFFHAAPSNL